MLLCHLLVYIGVTVLQRIRGRTDVSKEIAEVQKGLQEGGGYGNGGYGWRELLVDAPVRRALILGCGLQAMQQLVGINTVM
jgi:MFS transporter, SP family, solute carrier family 2 (myo-inositol transporter), member 13